MIHTAATWRATKQAMDQAMLRNSTLQRLDLLLNRSNLRAGLCRLGLGKREAADSGCAAKNVFRARYREASAETRHEASHGRC